MSVLRRFLAAQRDELAHWHKRRGVLLPPLDRRDGAVVAALHRDGGVVTSLDALALDGTAPMLEAADRLAALTAGRAPGKGGFIVQPRASELETYPELIAWGLNERLLAIVGNYLGRPVRYRGVTMRRDIVGGAAIETRLWHRDDEDHRICKIIVYLNEVGLDGGPYEFVPRPHGPARWRLPLGYGRIEDADMARWAPAAHWRPCLGPRGTVVFSDTCGVLHRGRIAAKADRLTLFFCYNSTEPLHPEHCGPLFDRAAFRAHRSDLSRAQRAAIGE